MFTHWSFPAFLPSFSPHPHSEAKARTTNAQQGDREFLEAACRFLPACTPHQVRMAPEKCERRGGEGALSAPWAAAACWRGRQWPPP